jgi:hypothetical protein
MLLIHTIPGDMSVLHVPGYCLDIKERKNILMHMVVRIGSTLNIQTLTFLLVLLEQNLHSLIESEERESVCWFNGFEIVR